MDENEMIESEGFVGYREIDGTEITVYGAATNYEDFVNLFVRVSLAAGFQPDTIREFIPSADVP